MTELSHQASSRLVVSSLLPGLAIAVLAGGTARSAFAADSLGELRERMVRVNIEAEGVRDKRVLRAMRTVPRHEFVSPSMRRYAYQDSALPIGHRQTISPPFIVAYMTETIAPRETDRVLEIGTGSGYQAAVLSELVRDVFTIEIVEPLGRAARRRLQRLKYGNVHTRIGDGYKGWAEKAPFDKIIVTCSPEKVPAPLVDQLKEGGRLLIPLGERYQQVFHLFEKKNGRLVQTKLIPALFVPMTGISESRRKIKPDPLRPRIINGGFEETEKSPASLLSNVPIDQPSGWYYRRQVKISTETPVEGRRCLELSNRDPGRLSQVLQGFPVDGRRIGKLQFTLRRRVLESKPGRRPDERPGLTVVFFDVTRRPIGERRVGSWTVADEWVRTRQAVVVPARAREAIVRIGLGGAVGHVLVDDVAIVPVRR
ncbi:MAG: protein-L-isoaspartate O-methyltransferase [Planctomycetaceae bacterium]|nr:protein-L-isoaspartate O-methyltransferase [Planctomycetaceae bacterium]|tara:strand:- start:2341 stop:3618 length:1278 start_codon:yes stop_codon:yes gene_type:complete